MSHFLITEASRFTNNNNNNWLLRNLGIQYRSYISPPLVPIWNKVHPFPASQPTSFKSILILSSNLCLGLPKCLSLGFPTKIVCISGFFHMHYMSRPSQSSGFLLHHRVFCSRAGLSLQAQESRLHFCRRQVFHHKLKYQGCSFTRD